MERPGRRRGSPGEAARLHIVYAALGGLLRLHGPHVAPFYHLHCPPHCLRACAGRRADARSARRPSPGPAGCSTAGPHLAVRPRRRRPGRALPARPGASGAARAALRAFGPRRRRLFLAKPLPRGTHQSWPVRRCKGCLDRRAQSAVLLQTRQWQAMHCSVSGLREALGPAGRRLSPARPCCSLSWDTRRSRRPGACSDHHPGALFALRVRVLSAVYTA